MFSSFNLTWFYRYFYSPSYLKTSRPLPYNDENLSPARGEIGTGYSTYTVKSSWAIWRYY